MLMYHFHIHQDLRYAYTEVVCAFSVYECCSQTGASDLNIKYWGKLEGKKKGKDKTLKYGHFEWFCFVVTKPCGP